MSHFTVLVVGKNIEDQLDPYYEGEEVEPYFTDEGSIEDWFEDLETSNSHTFIKDKKSAQLAALRMRLKEISEEEGREYKIDGDRVVKETTYNPQSKWDWYEVGGRWSGFFTLKDGSKADSATKGEIDFEGMRKHEEDEARKYYRKVVEAFGGEIPRVERSWDEVVEDDSLGDIDAKKNYYHSQPAMKAKQKAESKNPDLFGWGFDLEYFACSEEEYVAKVGRQAYSTFAVLENGVWHERGQMCMFGMSNDKMTQDEWNEAIDSILEGLSDDTLLTIVDCHI